LVYVSSGHSNGWFKEQPIADQPSGFGREILLERPTRAEWTPCWLNRHVGYQMSFWLGRFGIVNPREPCVGMALGKSTDFEKIYMAFGKQKRPIHVEIDAVTESTISWNPCGFHLDASFLCPF
jgi:hypothetical protein